jgi:hypothetical protein
MTDMDKLAAELRAKAREICMYVLPDYAEVDIKALLDERDTMKRAIESDHDTKQLWRLAQLCKSSKKQSL